MLSQKLGTACAYGQRKSGGGGTLGSSVADCCLGDQILSQKAQGLARQSPRAQDWFPGEEEMDGDLQLFRKGAGVTPLPKSLTPGKDMRRKVCLVVYLSFAVPAQTYAGMGESALRACTKAGVQVPSTPGLQPLPHVPAPPCDCPWDSNYESGNC